MEHLIRQEIQKVLKLDATAIPIEANLIEFGLHSLALMWLIEPLSALKGAQMEYRDLARNPSIKNWMVLMTTTQHHNGD